MQGKFDFYEVDSELLQEYNKNNIYNQEYINKLFNIKLVTNKPEDYQAWDIVSLEECIEFIKKLNTVSVDIETTRKFNGTKSKQEGLDPHLSNIVMFQIGNEHTQFVIDTRNVNIQKLVEILPQKQVVGHNLKFEYKHILHNYGVRLEKIYDTMITEKVLYNGFMLKNGLKDLNERYLSIKVDKSTRLGFLFIKDRPYTFKEIKYGAEDILYPILIKKLQEENIQIKNLGKCIDLEFDFCKVLGDIEYKGLGFDQEKWLKLYEKNLSRYKDYENRLSNWIIGYDLNKFIDNQYDLFNDDINCNINWGSSKQVIELFRDLGICPQEKSKTTKKMAYTVEAKVLRKSFNNINKNISKEKEELINIYLKYKEIEQTCTTFGKDFLKNVNPVTNRLHSDYNQIINTGRISSRGPNLQNIPSLQEFRECFNCSDEKNIINADYSGQESVVLANQSLDENMVDFYLNGDGDLHSYVATRMFRIIDNDPDLFVPPKELRDGSDNPEFTKIHKEKREAAKAINFKLAYGGSAYTLKDDFKVDEETAQKFIDTYFDAFPGLKNFFKTSKEIALRNGFVEIDPITKRKYFFKDINKLKFYKRDKDWKNFFYFKGKYERASVNYKIQGTAGSITKRAGILFREWIKDNNLFGKVDITNIIHDEINVESLKIYSKEAAKALEKCMEEAGKPWCKTVPLKAGAVITNYWTH